MTKREAKHTPGPWSLQEIPDYGEDCLRVIVIPEIDMVVAAHDECDEPVELANARLIAAAPELLDALKLIVADFGDYPASDRPCHAFDVARAAIAKAEGAK